MTVLPAEAGRRSFIVCPVKVVTLASFECDTGMRPEPFEQTGRSGVLAVTTCVLDRAAACISCRNDMLLRLPVPSGVDKCAETKIPEPVKTQCRRRSKHWPLLAIYCRNGATGTPLSIEATLFVFAAAEKVVINVGI